MKKLYVLTLATVMVAGTVTAQRSYTGTAVPMVPFNIGAGGERSNLDSIYYEEAFGATATWSGVIFTINGAAGYVYGNNFYADKAKALAFMLGDLHPGIGHNVTGAGFVFAAKEFTSGNPNSVVTATLYDLNGTGTTTAGAGQAGAPGTVLATVPIPMASIDTAGGITYAVFPSQVFRGAGQEYAIGIDLTTMITGDTVCLLASDDQEFVQPEVSWEKWSNNTWYTMNAAWTGLENVPYLFATVSLKGADVPEMAEYGVVLGQNYPNPTNAGITTIGYGVDQPTTVTLDVFDMVGNKVMSINEGTRGEGAYKVSIDTKGLTAGTYFYTLTTEHGVATRKMTVTK